MIAGFVIIIVLIGFFFEKVLPEATAGQSNLVYLISAIRVIPLDNLVQTVTAVIKNPPPCEGVGPDVCLDVAILELFYWYYTAVNSKVSTSLICNFFFQLHA